MIQKCYNNLRRSQRLINKCRHISSLRTPMKITRNISNKSKIFSKKFQENIIFDKNLSFVQVISLFNIFQNYYNNIINFSKNNRVKIRAPNFPESLSENIVRWFIINKENRDCISPTKGDLLCPITNKRIEVKCFTSNGPSTFGSNEPWDELWFLDASNLIKSEFKIYKCTLSNKSKEWNSIKFNADTTFGDMCKTGKRPRINFTGLKKQINNNMKLVYSGDLLGLK